MLESVVHGQSFFFFFFFQIFEIYILNIGDKVQEEACGTCKSLYTYLILEASVFAIEICIFFRMTLLIFYVLYIYNFFIYIYIYFPNFRCHELVLNIVRAHCLCMLPKFFYVCSYCIH